MQDLPAKNNNITDVEGGTFELKEGFVAPWGLAYEERPFHFLWSGAIESLNIYYPDPVSITEGYNIEGDISEHTSSQKTGEGENLTVMSLDSSALETAGYFSGKFIVPEIFEGSIVAQKIIARFKIDEGKTTAWEDITFTIRPKIRVADAPETYVVPEDGDLESVKIRMEYVGFGMAQVTARAGWQGKIISKGDSIYHDFADALVESGLYEKEWEEIENVPKEWYEDSNLEIPQKEIERFVDDLRESIEGGEVRDVYETETVDQLVSFLEAGEKDRDMSPIYNQVEMLILGSVIDSIDRRPAENVEMSNPQTIAKIESEMDKFIIEYDLEDTLDNNYGTTEIPIDIENHRSNEADLIEIEIETGWDQIQLDTGELQRLKEEIEDL